MPDYAGTPGFFYFHMMSTHLNGYKQAIYTKFTPSKSVLSIVDMFLGKSDRRTVINNYDNGVFQTD